MFARSRGAATLAAAAIALDPPRRFLDRFVRDAPPSQYAADIVKIKRLLRR